MSDTQPETTKPSWWQRLTGGLKRTSSSLSTAVADLVTKRKLDRAMLDDIEDVLLRADLGTEVAARIAAAIGVGRYDKAISADDVKSVVAAEVEKVLSPVAKPLLIDAAQKPFVILVVGVNGSGKTTTIGKLAAKLAAEGRKVMLAALGGELCRELADGGGLAGTVDADHENHERLLRRVDQQGLCHRRKHLLDFGRDHAFDVVRRDRLVVTADADGGCDPRRHLGAEIGAQQHVLDVVEHRAVELALGDEIGDRGTERTRGPLQPAGQPPPPAQFGRFGLGIAHVGGVLAVSRHERKSQPTH